MTLFEKKTTANTFWRLTTPSLLFAHFAYIDTPSYMADDIFVRNKLRVKYDKEYEHPDYPYRIVFCHVFRNNAAHFEKCMTDLEKKILLCGHPTYVQDCQTIMHTVSSTAI